METAQYLRVAGNWEERAGVTRFIGAIDWGIRSAAPGIVAAYVESGAAPGLQAMPVSAGMLNADAQGLWSVARDRALRARV